MPNLNFIILYVASPAASARFYRGLLDREPAAEHPNFAAFALDGGWTLGLWANASVAPEPSPAGNRGELAFTVPDAAAVDATHAEWVRNGVRIAQEPVTMAFGRTFTGLDPDGHRLRVCLPDAD